MNACGVEHHKSWNAQQQQQQQKCNKAKGVDTLLEITQDNSFFRVVVQKQH
jgi:hypothetical protein